MDLTGIEPMSRSLTLGSVAPTGEEWNRVFQDIMALARILREYHESENMSK